MTILPAVTVCPNSVSDILKTCSVEFIENGKDFCVLFFSKEKPVGTYSMMRVNFSHPHENSTLKM